ncbi:ArsB/NhaD family transporter [Thermodesulfitimonas sp.]
MFTYAAIVSGRVHRTVAAFVGAVLLVLTGIMPPDGAVHAIDWNTIGLLVGMMIIVGVTQETGVFRFLAVKAVKATKGEPLAILAALSAVTAFLSAFLDNVTTVLLVVPVTLTVAKRLALSPLPFLLAEILASNIGGTATLIGDPPNIMIGSAAGLGFMDFIINLTPVVLPVYLVTIFILQLLYRRQLRVAPAVRQRIFELDERAELKDPVLLRQCLFVLGTVILGFFLHQYLHLESSVVALSGAALLLLITRSEPEHAFHAIEWPVIFFFVGLFVVVGALVEVGAIEALAKFALGVTGGALIPTGIFIMWFSALTSAFVDNIPFVATMIPLLKNMGRLGHLPSFELSFLWWCLALGACLGGNGTIIGASANVVVAGMAEKRGLILTFWEFFRVGFPLMLLSILLCSGYMLLWVLLGTGRVALLSVALALLFGLLPRLWWRCSGQKEEGAEA